MSASSLESLIPRMYECAFDRAAWNDTLQSLVELAGARGATISLADFSAPTSTIAEAFGQSAEAVAQYQAHFHTLDPLLRLGPLRDGQWLSDWSELGPAYRLSEYYNDFMLAHDNHAVLFTSLWQDGDRAAVIALQRSRSQGVFEPTPGADLLALTPHLRRAARLHFDMRVLRERTEHCTSALNRLAMPTMLLEATGKLVFVNEAAHRLLEAGTQLGVHDGFLVASNGASALQKAVVQAGAAPARPRWLRLPAAEDGQATFLVVAPLPAASGYAAEWQRPLVLVMVGPDRRSNGRAEAAIAALYGLTPAEARVAAAVAEGLSPEQIASRHGVTVPTIRQQLKLVYAKTGTGRQAALSRLVTMLLGAAPVSEG